MAIQLLGGGHAQLAAPRVEPTRRRVAVTTWNRIASQLALALATWLSALAAQAAGSVGFTFPPGFPVIADASLGTPLIGFGAAGPVARTPVIFVHGH